MRELGDMLVGLLPFLAVVAGALAALLVVDRLLRRRWKDEPDAQFRFQLIMLALTLVLVLTAVSSLPVSDALRAQLLSLIGILLSAAIALSSTTFIGNIMAGVMLKTVHSARPGDFITVEDLTGRITEMGLLHTEIQTELRDLVTVPNIYMVTRPLKVVRASGSIITAEVSLGYDVPHELASQILREAAETSGLKDCFVHVRALGDFSVTYRAAGLLEDISSLISAHSRLMAAMLDALHSAGIEIVSPNYMTTRALAPDTRVLPPHRNPTPAAPSPVGSDTLAEDLAFDKAEDAASAEKLRDLIEDADAMIKSLQEADGDHATEIEGVEARLERLRRLLQQAEARVTE